MKLFSFLCKTSKFMFQFQKYYYYYYYYYYFQLRTTALRLTIIVQSWLDVPTFTTRRLQAWHHTRAPSGGRWKSGPEMSGNFA
jgi:hypothetical protein